MKKILIVDDEEKVRKLVEVTLSVGKLEILHASSGNEALKIARETKPDLILLDIMMPGKLDGFDVCRLLKKDPDTQDIYVIMLTAKGQQADKERGLAMGADDYFVKPFSPMELMDKIDKVLA
ncbi:MAG: response regulator [Desulfobacterales bacterium]|jgi:DNA-binding response OmpR family regulator|nr:MAG: response regulator [Desulfobacterales bacterium]